MVWVQAAKQFLSSLHHVTFVIYHAAPDKEIWIKKTSSQTGWLDKAKHETGLKDRRMQSAVELSGYKRRLENYLPLVQTDAWGTSSIPLPFPARSEQASPELKAAQRGTDCRGPLRRAEAKQPVSAPAVPAILPLADAQVFPCVTYIYQKEHQTQLRTVIMLLCKGVLLYWDSEFWLVSKSL